MLPALKCFIMLLNNLLCHRDVSETLLPLVRLQPLPHVGQQQHVTEGRLRAGVPEKGRLFCERVPFPEANLFLDPERVAYRELLLYEGFGRTFFSRATPKASPCAHPLTSCRYMDTTPRAAVQARTCQHNPLLRRQACDMWQFFVARKSETTWTHPQACLL